jgi:hypothetical protein
MKFEINIREEVDQKQFNFNINNNYDIESIISYNSKIIVTANITETEKTEIVNYYNSLTSDCSSDIPYCLLKYMNSYDVKEKDGHDYYNKKRSELVIKIVNGERTEEETFEIDTKLKSVKDSLLSGDWKTARAYLDLVIIEGPFTQDLKDEYYQEITDYIISNY